MYIKVFFASIFAILTIYSVVAQKVAVISAVDLKNLNGCWQGTLNYSGTIIRKPYTTTAELVVKQIGNSNNFEFSHIYTKDPGENVVDTVRLSRDGRKLNDGTIKSKRNTSGGNVEIITEVLGFDHDNNKAAIIRQTYSIGKRFYIYKKQVQLAGQIDWLDRQEFKYISKPCLSKS
ncbi:MAG: hypothetical protein AVDCRST_MAG96-4296 [uncultured Segetibacter sp.]|uniref:Uncharacterized protein n=1 Tax=uncultured Segetibacter sp. TaxID=481133 RepID=A0A6J4U615_9BACT|nr:MAG: hypothetical protein AVDCRST_MAG96-4296 [uncultured Segetibacter sp.]